MTARNKIAAGTGIAAGVMLLIYGTSGAQSWQTIAGFVVRFLVDTPEVRFILAAIIGIASLGGLSVIAGAS